MLPRQLKYARPESVAEAVELLAAHPEARPLAGGQSIVNVLKLRAAEVEGLVDISRLEELRPVTLEGNSLVIGAGVRYAELAAHPLVREHQPVVAEIASRTADVQVRNRGTLGGNICFNDPTSNYPPLLVALGGTIRLTGPDRTREVAAGDFFLGPFRCALDAGELVHSVVLPALPADAGVGYQTLELARESWALARAAAWLRCDRTIHEARVVIACLGPRPARQPSIEAALVGSDGSEAAVTSAVAEAIDGVDAVGDSHASAEYRLEMARVQAALAIGEALEQSGGAA